MPEPTLPYLDAALSVEARVDDLLGRLTREDKVGLLFHPHGGLCDPEVPYEDGRIPVAEQIRAGRINHFALQGTAADAREAAEFHNRLQEIAAEHPLAIPVTLSSDPRHSAQHNLLTSNAAGAFSEWPEPLGLGALRSPDLVERYAEVVRREYVATGIRVALHPQVDLPTEPRWARTVGSFSEDADLTSRLVAGYVRGLQGEALGASSVAAMTKHFPGGGPQRGGLDPHFADGREQVYPGGRFATHLKPFVAAIAAGTAQMMPYYGMPVGTQYPEVGFAFSREIITALLRVGLGFDGVVCTDWTLITDISPDFPAKAWGVEHLTPEGRALMLLDAGVDQFGGENCWGVVMGLLASGRIEEESLEPSLRRILRDKFRLGLFDEARFVDAAAANSVVGAREHIEAGLDAQRRSMVLLKNEGGLLPLRAGLTVYVEGFDPSAFDGLAAVTDDPAAADVAVLRLGSPDYSDPALGWMGSLHKGSLEFDDRIRAHVERLAGQVPVVADVHLERPAILTGVLPARALLASFGTADSPFAEVLFGRSEPEGRLPFDLPSSMAAVEESATDVPFATRDPLFRFGDGLDYPSRTPQLLPRPRSLENLGGELALPPLVPVSAPDEWWPLVAELVEPGTGLRLERSGPPLLVVERFEGAEGAYTLEIADRVTLRAADAGALASAVASLRQLMPDHVHGPAPLPGVAVALPRVRVADEPLHGWRGMLLDPCRHFIPLPALYRFVDLFAAHKFNRLHLHLNDDQGWRFESKAWPQLTTVGATRRETRKPHQIEGDGQPHGGFYTQDQLRTLVAYARRRGIVVVPELDVPGHTQALLAAYPEFGEGAAGLEVSTTMGVHSDVLHLSDQTVSMLEDLFGEVLDVFDSEWVHVGGDECPTTQWEASEDAARLARERGLAGPGELQGWLTRHLRGWLAERGRQMIGWDEMVEREPVPGAIVTCWRGHERGLQTLEAGHRVIMALDEVYYIDHHSTASPEEPHGMGGVVRWESIAEFDPLEGASPDRVHDVVGIQGQLWTECIATPEHLEYMAFPRAAVIAEVAWAGPIAAAALRPRLRRHLRRLDAAGVNYRPLEGPHPWQRRGSAS